MQGAMRQRVIINWGISSFFGWGIYGLNLALNWLDDAEVEPMCAIPITDDEIVLDPLQRRAMEPFLQLSANLQRSLQVARASGRCHAECPVLTWLDMGPACIDSQMSGRPTFGVVFFETAALGADSLARARDIPLIITGSSWNRRVLNEHGLTNVATVLQGIDPTLFHPAPRSNRLANRFCIFSGGKLEYRKGQDIVLAAFRIFARRHPDALLVTAWHSPWPHVARTIDVSPFTQPVTFNADGNLDVTQWAVANEIDPAQIIDLGQVPNRQLPTVVREMDVAVFANRSEGGTNLVAMECMACGVPVVLSENTGHLDLVDPDVCFPLHIQNPLDGIGAGIGNTPGWGESSVDEIVETLERIYVDRDAARRRGQRGAEMLAGLTWARTAERMKELVLLH
jgi:glycosyltransferase involved in cell wall biosynthesis